MIMNLFHFRKSQVKSRSKLNILEINSVARRDCQMGNVCSGPSVSSLSTIYLSGLSSPGMAANSRVDPVHPNVAKQKQYQVCRVSFLQKYLTVLPSGGCLQVPQHRPQYRRVAEQSGSQIQGDPSLPNRSSVPGGGHLTTTTQGRD